MVGDKLAVVLKLILSLYEIRAVGNPTRYGIGIKPRYGFGVELKTL